MRKANHIADAEKTPDGLISLKDVEKILKLVKVELGEATDITHVQSSVDKESEEALQHALSLKQNGYE